MPTDIFLTQDDYGYAINFTLQDANANAFDLTGNTGITFIAQISGVDAAKISSAMVAGSPLTAGTCYYTVAQGNFDIVGTYLAEIQVTFTGKVISFPGIVITVNPKVPF